MTNPESSPPTRLYDEIEATLAGTAQGRDFLLEHARRTRQADTRALLEAIARLESHFGVGQAGGDVERLRGDLADMTDVLRHARADLAGMAPDDSRLDALTKTGGALDWIATSATQATSDVLNSTEKVQEVAWTMREGGFDAELCDRLDRHATEIYAACTSQDLTARRITRVVSAIASLEHRIGAVSRVWGAASPEMRAAPPLDTADAVLSNDDIDFVPVEPDMPEASGAEPASGPDGREAALAALRRVAELGTRDKLRLFT